MGLRWHGTTVRIGFAAGLMALLTAGATGQTSVLTQHNDNARTGALLTEKVLTPANVNGRTFGMLFKRVVDDQLYTQPLVAAGVRVAGGVHDLVLVTTVNNSVYAFDAKDAGAEKPFWHVNFGTPPNLHSADFGCLDMNGNMGIVGAPVIDEAKTTVYVVAETLAGGGFVQRLHALDLTTGADLPGSPVEIAAAGFDALMQNQRPALALAAGRVLIGYASHCDKQPYHGFLLSYDARTMKQMAVLNTSPGGDGASIWQSGQAPSLDADGNIFVITGNGSWDGKTQWSESFLKVDRDLKVLDWFTPTNHVQLDKDDNDLDSSGATLVPGTNLVLGGGKEGVLYVLDQGKLGHLGDEHAVQHFHATASHIHSLVFWQSAQHGPLLYVWGQRDKERVYRLRGGKLEEKPVMTRTDANEGHPGAMLSLSSDGGKNGILWAAIHASGDSWHESRPGVLHAYDADDISHELWNSLENAKRDDCGKYSKMAPPTIANGMVYLASFGAENTGTGQLCVYGLLAGGGRVPGVPGMVKAEVEKGWVDVRWEAVAGAETYSVERRLGGEVKMVASGLTGTGYREAAVAKGRAEYRVVAGNSQGNGAWSGVAAAKVEDVPVVRGMVMH